MEWLASPVRTRFRPRSVFFVDEEDSVRYVDNGYLAAALGACEGIEWLEIESDILELLLLPSLAGMTVFYLLFADLHSLYIYNLFC